MALLTDVQNIVLQSIYCLSFYVIALQDDFPHYKILMVMVLVTAGKLLLIICSWPLRLCFWPIACRWNDRTVHLYRNAEVWLSGQDTLNDLRDLKHLGDLRNFSYPRDPRDLGLYWPDPFALTRMMEYVFCRLTIPRYLQYSCNYKRIIYSVSR